MSLVDKTWERVTIHHAVLEWLRAERFTNLTRLFAQLPPEVWLSGLTALLDNANLNNADQNRARLRLLYMFRNVFVLEIPPDTEWFLVSNLMDDELSELHVVNYPEWVDPADRNELVKAAARRKLTLRTPTSSWAMPILWGHDRCGPFTILEGNHRLAAYVFSGTRGLETRVIVGLSPMKCVWHILDECQFLMQDLLRR